MKQRNRLISLALLWPLLLAPVLLLAQTKPEPAAVEGRIQGEDGEPVFYATIYVNELERQTHSAGDGRFRLQRLPAGSYTLTVFRMGYAQTSKQVSLTAGATERVEFKLVPTSLSTDAVTVTGTPTTKSPLLTTTEVTTLGGAEKFQRQQASMGASLRHIPGVQNLSTGNVSGKPVIRGLTGNRILMMQNGLAVDYQQFGVRHLPPMDPFLAKQIEVVQGPASILYGSNALGGAINVIPVEAPIHAEHPDGLNATLMGDFQTNNNQGTGGLNLEGKKGRFGFSGSVLYKSGGNITTPDVRSFEDPEGQPNDPRFTGELDHTDFEQLNATATLSYDAGIGDINLNYTRFDNEHNFLLPDGNPVGQFIGNNNVQLSGRFALGNKFLLKPTVGYFRNRRIENEPGESRDELPGRSGRGPLDILREDYAARIELKHYDTGILSGTLGLQSRITDQTAQGLEEVLVPTADIFNIGVFALEEATFGKLTLSAGARIDFQTQEAEPSEEIALPDSNETDDVLEQDYTIVSGSFGANYRLTDHLAVAVNIGRGFRAPGMFDLHVLGVHNGVAAFQVGNPDLEEETSLNTDFSIKWRSPKLRATATVYRNAIDDYIFLNNTGQPSPAGPPILRADQTDARLIGGHIGIQAELLRWLQVSAQGEFVDGESRDDNDAIGELPLMPANRLGGNLRVNLPSPGILSNVFVELGVEHVFEKDAAGRYEPFWQFDGSFPFGVASTDAYTLLNARIGADLELGGNRMHLLIYGENLTDEDYRDFLDTYKGYALSPGINVGIRASIPITIAKKQAAPATEG